VLNGYKKGITADISYRAIQILRKYKIRSMAGFIIGELNETREMIKDTIKFAIKLNPDIAQFSILTPYPGTRLFESVKGNLLTRDWAFYDGLHALIKITRTKPKDLEKLLKEAYLRFYLRLSRFLSNPMRDISLFRKSLRLG